MNMHCTYTCTCTCYTCAKHYTTRSTRACATAEPKAPGVGSPIHAPACILSTQLTRRRARSARARFAARIDGTTDEHARPKKARAYQSAHGMDMHGSPTANPTTKEARATSEHAHELTRPLGRRVVLFSLEGAQLRERSNQLVCSGICLSTEAS